MKITANRDIASVGEISQVARFTTLFIENATNVINGNIEFGDNIKSQKVSVVFSTANVEVQVSHGLGRVAQGYFLVGSTVAMSLYDGTTSNTAVNLYLKSSVAGTAQVMVF